MAKLFPRVFILLLIINCCATLADADIIPIGAVTFDANTPTALATFDITNLTGTDAFPPTFPITTQLTITVTSLVANLQGGGMLTIDGSDFSVADPQGDIDCTVAGDAGNGGCNLSAYHIVSATITGTLSPLTGLAGLPKGDTGVEGSFTTTVISSCGGPTLTAGCDSAIIPATAVPEPAMWTLLGIVLAGLLAGYKFKGRPQVS